MSRDFTATAQLSVSSGLISDEPFSMGCWFRKDDITSNSRLMQIGTSASNDQSWILNADGGVGGDPIRFIGRTTTSATAATSTGFSANTWHHALAIAASNIDRRVYIDGGSEGSNTSNKVITAPNAMVMGLSLVSTSQLEGQLAEAAVWNIALDAVDRAMLALGISPLFVRPDALVAYWPIIGRFSPEIDRIGGNNATVTGTIAAAHPRIVYPPQATIMPFAVGAPPSGRIMSSLAGHGGLAGMGGLAGQGGGLAG